jgi:Family of unknown function (DUF6152)
MSRYILIFVASALLVYAVPAYTHHSFAAAYVEGERVTVEGDLVQFLFRSPHSFVHVEGKDKDGNTVRWAVEWAGTARLAETGINKGTLKIGDHVIITGTPGRDPADHRVRLLTLTRPKDGFTWGDKPEEKVD